MSRLINTRRIGFLASVIMLLVAIQGCSTDSPTAPVQVPGPPPGSGGNNWKITVTVNPNQLIAGSDTPSTVTAKVDSRDNPGTSPPNGTTMSFFTNIGEFGAQGSDATNIAVVIDRGKASALLFAGDVVAGGTVEAQLEGSTGRKGFSVVSEDVFITAVTPPTGPAAGGTVVTIDGVGFRANARVFFGDKLGTLSSVNSTRIVATTPPADLVVQSCDDDGDGILGSRTEDKPVNVKVEFADGGSETLNNGYTYLSPTGDTCVGD